MPKNHLRRTPEIILIGEGKDADAMQEAIAACAAGHLVYSTVHSHDSAVARQVFLGERDLKQLVRSLQPLVSQPHLPLLPELSVCEEVIQQLLETHPHLSAAPIQRVPVVRTPVRSGPRPSNELMVEVQKAVPAHVLGPLGTQETKKLGGLFKHNDDFVWTHAAALEGTLLFGCCGSGRSEALPGFAMEAARTGCGLFYVSTIKDSHLGERAARLGQHLGRLDQVRYVQAYGDQHRDQDNGACRYNPLDDGTPEELVEWFMEVIEPMLARTLDAPDRQHVRACLTPLLSYLSWRRNVGKAALDLRVLEQHLTSEAMQRAAEDTQAPPNVRAELKTWREKQQSEAGQAFTEAMAFVVVHILQPLLEWNSDTLLAPRTPKGWLKSELIVSEAWALKQLVFFEGGCLEKYAPVHALLARMPMVRLSQVVKKAAAGKEEASKVHMLLVANDVQFYANLAWVEGLNEAAPQAGLGRVWVAPDYSKLKQWVGQETALAVVAPCALKLFMSTCEKGHTGALIRDAIPPLHASYNAVIEQAFPHADLVASSHGHADQLLIMQEKNLRQVEHLESLEELHPGSLHAIAGGRLVRLSLVYVNTGALPKASLPKLPARLWMPHTTPVAAAASEAWAKRLLTYWQSYPATRNEAGAVKLSWCQEALARMLGRSSWHDLTQQRR